MVEDPLEDEGPVDEINGLKYEDRTWSQNFYVISPNLSRDTDLTHLFVMETMRR